MSLHNTTPSITPTKDESHTSAGGDTSGGGGGGRKTSALKPPEQILNCPRCDSPNTKFCYYNNYSLTQPRHFCKTCRRYWTKGGALRNVPIGGGCRKKKTRSSSSSRFFNGDSLTKDSSLDNTGSGLSLFTGLSPPAMDFQLNGLNHFSSSSSSITPQGFMNLDSLRFNFPIIKHDHHHHHQLHGGLASIQEIGTTVNNNNNLASSIESLSSINQDLHWRLQQQRLAAMLGARGGGDGGGGVAASGGGVVAASGGGGVAASGGGDGQKLQPMFFQNLEIPKPSQTTIAGDGGGLETEWFIEGSFEPVNVDQTTETTGNYESGNMNNNWNNGIQVWNQFNQYSVLP